MQVRKRAALIAVASVLFVVVTAVVGYLRWKAPPEVARLLPEADAIVYCNLKPLREATHFDRNAPVPAAEYKHFIDATGIVPERDLDEGAISVHKMADPYGPNGATGFSEVFAGHFDAARLTGYLASQSKSQEMYAGHVIYAIASTQGYEDRVTVLDEHRIAMSNMPSTEQIHAMLDHGRGSWAGSTLMRAHYGDVPAFSTAWALGRLGQAFAEGGRITVAGFQLPTPADSSFVASVRYARGIKLRVDQLTGTELEAAHTAQALTNLLVLIRTLEKQQTNTPEMNQMLDSLGVEAKKDRVTITGTIPAELLQQLAKAKQ